MAIRTDLWGSTMPELRDMARDSGMTGWSRLRKAELIDAIEGAQSPSGPVPGSHVVFDVETTGLGQEDVAIQLGAQIYVPGQEPISYSTYIDPQGRESHPKAQETHGITPEMLQGAPSQEEAWGELDRLIASVGGVESAVAHNLPFDIRFASQSSSLRSATQIDTLALARQAVSHGEIGGSYRLGDISKALGLPEFQAHEALADVGATKNLLDQLVQMGQSRNIPTPGIQPLSPMTPQAQALMGTTPSAATAQPPQYQQQQAATQAARTAQAAAQSKQDAAQSEYDTVLTDYMRYGFTRPELQAMVKEGLGPTGQPAQAREFLEQRMTAQYGTRPGARFDPSLGRMTEPYSPQQWRYTEEHRRVRGRTEMPWEEEKYGRMPGAQKWGEAQTALGAEEPVWTRQGSSSFYPISALSESGYWLPGSTPGSVKTPVGPEKLAKRAQLLGAHETYDVYQQTARGLQEISTRASMRGGPASEVATQGIKLRAAMPLAQVTPAGQGMLAPGAIEYIGQRKPVDIKLPEGFETGELTPVGTTWRAGENIELFGGAVPLDLLRKGSWEQAELLDVARTEKGVRAVFGRSIAAEEASLYGKTGGTKEMLPVGDIQELTGRSDIDVLMQYKEPLGTAWQKMMAQSPERLQEMLAQQGYTGDMPETWKEAGEPLVKAFQGMIPDITEDVRYTWNVHKSNVDKTLMEMKEQYGGSLKQIGEEMYEFSAEIPTMMLGETFMPVGRNFPTRRPFLSSR
ncbi:MAG TPA: exonuclease domain-containing protein, partial [Anaerolineae bacterium]|nr:exonuclease domain-containing protein [Anaerolineae bacterium]